ncbi:MAG: beta-ketoacyl-[acyl-carrier-protein] synthase family protein [Opitutales bacterium]
MDDVVVTGLGFITSIGNDKASVSDSLRHLRHGFERYPPFEDPAIPVKVLGTVKGFNCESPDQEDWELPEAYPVSRSFLRGLSPNALYGYCAMVQAIEDAGLTPEAVSDPETGLYTASAGSSWLLHHFMDQLHRMGVERANPKGIVASIAGTLNFNLVAQFRIRGSSCGFASACASSGHALGAACDEIRLGRQKRMFVVGAEDGNADCILPFGAMRALTINPDPDTASRPFDARRDGFVGTGGGAAVLLESRAEAEARGASIYGTLLGWGQSSDGFNTVLPHPEGLGLIRAMTRALENAGIPPAEIDYINAHAPSTSAGDAAEMLALKEVFSRAGAYPGISSTKSLTGHGLSLGSIMEAGFCLLGMREGFTPGSAHIGELDAAAEDLNILRATRDEVPRLALSNSSGFGGANVSLLFGKP